MPQCRHAAAFIQIQRAKLVVVSQGALDILITRTLSDQTVVVEGMRLNIHPGPAQVIKVLRNRVHHGIPGARVHIKAVDFIPAKARASITSSKFWA